MKRIGLLNFLVANRAVTPAIRGARIEAKGDEATIFLYDVIVDSAVEAEWFGGVAAESFVKEIRDLQAKTIHLRINSPGGSVFAARAIEQAIREKAATVVAHIDGYAASAASTVMLAADQIVASPGALVMIHKSWGVAMGNCDDMRATADLLDKVDGTLVASYAKRMKASEEEIAAMLAAETWFTADEALDAGLIDLIADEKVDARIEWDLSAYDRSAKAPPAATTGAAALAEILAEQRRKDREREQIEAAMLLARAENREQRARLLTHFERTAA